MITELKTYQLSCDGCNHKMTIENIAYVPELPEGWQHVIMWGHPQRLDKDFCPKCADKAEALNKSNEELRKKYQPEG